MTTKELIQLLKEHDPKGEKEVIIYHYKEHWEITSIRNKNNDVVLGIHDDSIEFNNDIEWKNILAKKITHRLIKDGGLYFQGDVELFTRLISEFSSLELLFKRMDSRPDFIKTWKIHQYDCHPLTTDRINK